MIAHTLEAHPFLLSSFCKQQCCRAQEDLGIGGGEAAKDLEDARGLGLYQDAVHTQACASWPPSQDLERGVVCIASSLLQVTRLCGLTWSPNCHGASI